VKRLIYPATRAVEHAVSVPGVAPIRFFPVLWPLWQVEASAAVYEKQDFELIDHFILRAIEEGGIHDRAELVHFLNLPVGLVDRCLAFLGAIRHVTATGSTLRLEELGQMSVRDGVRYVAATHRLTILIDRQTGTPLPRPYYDGNVPVLDTPEIPEEQRADRTRFLRVFSSIPFNPAVIGWLEEQPERAQFNLPGQLRNLRQEGVREAYLPTYLIETADRSILAYSAVSQQRDEFLEQLCSRTSVDHLIEAEGIRDPEEIWRKWLAQSTQFGSGQLRRSRNGIWQVVLNADAFGEHPKLSYVSLGSYRVRENHFIQIWCTNLAARRLALKKRLLGIAMLPEITSVRDLEQRIEDLAHTLQVSVISVAALREYAKETRSERQLARIDSLLQGGA
jgi:hypothetical protein